MTRRGIFGAALVLLLGLGLSALVARQSAVDGTLQPVSDKDSRGSWRAGALSPAPGESTLDVPRGWRLADLRSGQKLSEVVQPGDGEVIVLKRAEDFGVQGSGDDLEEGAKHADAVAIATPKAMRSQLTSARSGQDSIHTEIDWIIDQVFKAGEGLAHISVGDSVSFVVEGGSVPVGSARVTLKNVGTQLPVLGRPHLLFLQLARFYTSPDGTVADGPALVPLLGDGYSMTFEIGEANLTRLFRPAMGFKEFAREPAFQRIGEAVRLPRREGK